MVARASRQSKGYRLEDGTWPGSKNEEEQTTPCFLLSSYSITFRDKLSPKKRTACRERITRDSHIQSEQDFDYNLLSASY